jgi:spore coat assembly protein
MKQGDIVVRKSYGEDIRFRIERIEGDMAILRGLEVRLLADSPLSDLLLAQVSEEEAYRRWDALAEQRTQKLLESVRFQRQLYRGREASEGRTDEDTFDLPGKVLHLDGDPKYLRKCMQVYGRLKIPAEGHYLPESDMADFLGRILVVSKPDIVVITGHDGLYRNHQNKYDLASYKNSHHFVRAVQVARQYERNRDALTIIAGACQSHFEALLQAGANFASSPARILIHALDPVQVAVMAAYTSIRETVKVKEVLMNTQSGIRGIGGYETRGSFRLGTSKMD